MEVSSLKVIPLILTVVLLSVFCSSSPVRGEAVTAVLGEQAANYTCGKIKKMAQETPQHLFEMWANSGTIDTHSATAIQIIRTGNVKWMLDNIGDLTTSIQIIEEAVSGTPENALKILSKALLSKSFSAVMKIAGAGGAPGAALFVCETLYSFNGYLSAELLNSNLKSFANLSKKNPEMMDINYFQKTYLGWYGKSWSDQINKKYGLREMYARRNSVVAYANRKLLNPNFPQISEWDENINVVRTTIHIIIKDVKDILEKERKFKQLQEELKTELAALKKEQTVVTTFQALRNQLLAMTCQNETSQECLDIYTRTLSMLGDLILSAGYIKGIPSNTLEDLKDSVNSLYGNMESMDAILQTDYKSGIQVYCTKVKAGLTPLIEGISQAKAVNAEIAAQAAQAKTYMDMACAATSLSVAKDWAEMAKNMAEQAVLLFNNFPVLPVFEQPAPPPDPIDFSGREGGLSIAEEKIKKYKKIIEESLKKKQAFKDQVTVKRSGLKHMISKCKKDQFQGVDAQEYADRMERDIKKIESKIPDIAYQNMFIDGLSSKLEAIRWHLTSLEGQNQSYRECLENLPDSKAMLVEFTSLLETGKTNVDRAEQSAANAADCYDSLKKNSPCNADADCAPGYTCNNGKCIDSKPISCQTNGDCPKGYVCSDTGECILSEGGNLFSTSGGEDSKTGQGNLFGTTGGETIADETTHSGADIDCSHIPGSIAVQGNCICTDGLILSPSQGRCISCDEYYQAAKNAITDGALNAAQSIVNEANECTSWTAQVQGLINSARQDQVCKTIAANLRAACQSNNARAAHGFMGEANQNNCHIDEGLWQWGNKLIAEHDKRIKDQRAAQQQQAQDQGSQQPQKQTNWMDVMNEIVKGVQGIQQGGSRSSGGGSKPSSGPGSPSSGFGNLGNRTWNTSGGVVTGGGYTGGTSGSGSKATRKCQGHTLYCKSRPTNAWHVAKHNSISFDHNKDGICDICNLPVKYPTYHGDCRTSRWDPNQD